jgi:pilus assembly protein CpaB
MKNKFIPIISIILGLLASVLTYQYLHGREKELADMKRKMSQGTKLIDVLAAKRDIPSGTVISMEDLAFLQIPDAFVLDDSVRREDANLMVGRKTVFPIKSNDPIMWSKIDDGKPASKGLASMITHRMRALSISVGGAAAVSGMVQPADRVDILGTFSFPSSVPGEMETVTLTVLQDVTVLAVGRTTADQKASRGTASQGGFSTVTLEVTPREAELLVFAEQSKGRLTLTLRNSSDIYFEKDVPSLNFEKLRDSLPLINEYRQKTIRERK